MKNYTIVLYKDCIKCKIIWKIWFHMNISKVVLVQPPIEDFYLTQKRTIPYGLACIASALRDQGFEVKILDGLATEKSRVIEYPNEFSHLKPYYGKKDISYFSLFHEFRHFGYSYEHIGKWIRQEDPWIVGISSLFTAYADEAIKTAKIIKQWAPQAIIVMGGHHPTCFPEKVLAEKEIDFVIRGEAEISFPLLCKAIQTRQNPKSVPGLAFKKDGLFHISEPSFVHDPEGFFLPAMDLVKQEFYKRKKRYSTLVVSSRGCPMSCSYCSVSASSAYGSFRQRPVKDIVHEIHMALQNRDIGFIDFEDENLCFNKNWFLDLCKGLLPILAGRHIELRAMNGLYPPSIDNDLALAMKALGFKTLNLSLGSTSKEQLDRFNRRDVRRAFENALMLAETHGLEAVSYIIAAAPGQSAQSSLDDLVYLAKKRTLIGLSIYYPAPGSKDFKDQKETGILPKSFSLMRSSALPFDGLTSRLEAITLLRLSRLINYMKLLVDTFGSIPCPEPFPGLGAICVSDRGNASHELLQWFLYDGKIRGMTEKGEIYEHLIDEQMVNHFLKRLNPADIKGISLNSA